MVRNFTGDCTLILLRTILWGMGGKGVGMEGMEWDGRDRGVRDVDRGVEWGWREGSGDGGKGWGWREGVLKGNGMVPIWTQYAHTVRRPTHI